jgi:hypothetical protein
MKKSRNLFVFACLLAWGLNAFAQANGAAKNSSSTAGEKNKKASAEKKKTAPDEFAASQTGQIQYTTVDGRKVQTDNQGVQSLATPQPAPANQPAKSKTITPKK